MGNSCEAPLVGSGGKRDRRRGGIAGPCGTASGPTGTAVYARTHREAAAPLASASGFGYLASASGFGYLASASGFGYRASATGASGPPGSARGSPPCFASGGVAPPGILSGSGRKGPP